MTISHTLVGKGSGEYGKGKKSKVLEDRGKKRPGREALKESQVRTCQRKTNVGTIGRERQGRRGEKKRDHSLEVLGRSGKWRRKWEVRTV